MIPLAISPPGKQIFESLVSMNIQHMSKGGNSRAAGRLRWLSQFFCLNEEIPVGSAEVQLRDPSTL